MTAHHHPFNAWFPSALDFPHQHGIKIPPQHVFGQPAPLPPPPSKSQLRLPRMVDRAFSHHSRKRETIFPNAYKEDLYRLNGYCKNVTTHTDRASWDFSLNMPKPTTFKNAWTGVAPEKPHNKGYDGPNENEWGDTDNDADDEADEKDVDDLNLAASSGPDAEDDDDAYEEYERGRSPTTRRCTNGLWGGCAGTREKYNQCKARAAMVILRCLHASRK